MVGRYIRIRTSVGKLTCLPNELRDEILLAINFIQDQSKISDLSIVARDEDDTVRVEKIPRHLQSGIHHVQPVGMKSAGRFGVGADSTPTLNLPGQLKIVLDVVAIIIRINKILASVIGGIDVDQLHLSGKALLQKFQDLKVVAFEH